MPDEMEQKWPAVDAAYAFVLPSYQLMASRFEAADTRLTTLLTLSSSLTLAVPLFARNVQPTLSFTSPFFVFGIVIFLLGSAIGLFGRVTGEFRLPDPMIIYEDSLQGTEWEFKKNQIYFAGQNFGTNAEAVRKKGNVAIAVTLALLFEITAFVMWFSGSFAA